MIDWKSRINNKMFWISMISAVLLLIQVILKTFNVEIEIEILTINLTAIVNSIFTILALLGVVIDPTTEGLSD